MLNAKITKLALKNFLAPGLSAFLLALAFSRLNLGCLAWIGLIPLFIELRDKTRLQRWGLFFVFAALFFLGIIYWLAHVSLLGLIFLCLYLGFEFSFFGLLMPKIERNWSLVLIPLLWLAFERLRGFLFFGFGWGILGYSQFKNLALIQIARHGGVWAISLLILLINMSLTQIITRKLPLSIKRAQLALPACLLLAVYAFGYYSLSRPCSSLDIEISLIQANIPQEQKWDPEYSSQIMDKFSALSKKAANNSMSRLIIWPETSVPGYLLDEAKLYFRITSLAENLGTYLLVGSPREDYEFKKFYNTAFLFNPSGHLEFFHDKIHLVPFGEYIPYKNLFSFLNNTAIADFSAGRKYTLFEIKTSSKKLLRFGVLICFEDVFPALVRNFKTQGADFLVTITNEAWFKNSSEPAQHTAISVFRAIENQCWFLRCANTGISCFIDPKGKIRKKVEVENKDIFVQGIATLSLAD